MLEHELIEPFNSHHIHQAPISEHNQLSQEQVSRTIKSAARNLLELLLICILVNLTLRLDYVYAGKTISELSYTEMTQQILLLATSGCYYLLAFRGKTINYAAFLAGSFFAVLLIREMDFWLDYVFHGFWFYPAILLTLSSLYYVYKNADNFIVQAINLLNSKYMPLLATGIMLLLVFSRLFGMGSFWQGILDENYIYNAKNVAEEGTELLSYCIIFFASFRILKGESK